MASFPYERMVSGFGGVDVEILRTGIILETGLLKSFTGSNGKKLRKRICLNNSSLTFFLNLCILNLNEGLV